MQAFDACTVRAPVVGRTRRCLVRSASAISSAVQRARLFRRAGYVEQMPFAQGKNRLSHRLAGIGDTAEQV